MKTNLVLTGFMGSGKTTIGKELAKILEMEFVDTDEMIVNKAGMSINDIFSKHGEKHFRDIETQVTVECNKLSNCIISTGGGIVLRKENIENLQKNSTVFLLWAGADTVFRRVKGNNDRPLLKVEDPMKKIKDLLEYREKFYKENCDFEIDTDQLTVGEVTQKIKSLYLGC